MVIREVESPKLKDLVGGYKYLSQEGWKRLEEDIISRIQFVGSGKGAIAITLKYLSEKRIFSNKLAEVIVPDWIGYWVYNQIQTYAFPIKHFSERTKAIFVYHQYGFPQDMDKILEFATDKKLIVIEDCAHALESYYKGRLVGSIGDFSIYSFSKWFFCYALGGVRSKYDDFPSFVDSLIAKTPFGITLLKDMAKFIYEKSSYSNNAVLKKYANLFLGMSYSFYGEALKPSRLALRLFYSKIFHEIEIRRQRYHFFRQKTDHLGICDHLESEGVIPYVIPIRCSESKNNRLMNSLKDMNIVTGIYHFDVNRNLLSPNFVQTVWIPCHSGISDDVFQTVAETVLRIL